MEFPPVFGFLKLLLESIKITFKNLKLIASITALSLLLSSIFLLLFSFSYQSVVAYMTNSITSDAGDDTPFLQLIIFFALLLAVELTFMFSYIAVVHAAGIATVITTATSRTTGTTLSIRDLWSTVKAKWKFPFRKTGFRRPQNPMYLLSVAAIIVAIPVVMFNPNPVTIAIVSVVVIAFFVYSLYSSVVPALAVVVSVVEDGGEAAEALERSEKLVEGRRLHGFMVNLFFNIICLIAFGSSWMVLGDQRSLNLTVYGLFLINCVTVMRIILSVVYTMYYFQCKEYHGEEILPLGDFHYTKLNTNDIP